MVIVILCCLWTQTKFWIQFLKVEIVDNILKEEKQMKKRYQQQPQLWPEKQRERVKVICQVLSVNQLVCQRTQFWKLLWVVFTTRISTWLQRISRRRPKPKFFKSTSGSSSVEYSADVEDTGVRLYVLCSSLINLTVNSQQLNFLYNVNMLPSGSTYPRKTWCSVFRWWWRWFFSLWRDKPRWS